MSDSKDGSIRRIDLCHQNNIQSIEELLSIVGEKRIVEAGTELYNYCLTQNYTVRDLDYCINHQYTLGICRAFKGYECEKKLFNHLSTKYKTKLSDNELDLKFCIDMVIVARTKLNKKLAIGIQLKPISYLHANSQHMKSIKLKNEYKQWKFEEFYCKQFKKIDVTATFIIYHNDYTTYDIFTPEMLDIEIEKLINEN